MTILEANAACRANSANIAEMSKFTKAFRQTELENIHEGESFQIPEDYVVFAQRMSRNGKPVLDSQGNQVTAEFINVQTNTGRNVRFYPSSMVKVAFTVDDNGKNVEGPDRIKTTSGSLPKYCQGKDMDSVMQALKGCTIECTKLTSVQTRAFGVSNEAATSKDIVKQSIGEWNLIGDKKPLNWTV